MQWIQWGFKLGEPSPSTLPHEWGGLPKRKTITFAHITDCPTITVHVGKCYKALIDSGAAISLLRYSSYKNIEDCYKTPIQPTTAKLDTVDGSPMSAIGTTALHLRILNSNSHITLLFVTNYQRQSLSWALICSENSHYHMHGTRKETATYKGKENS